MGEVEEIQKRYSKRKAPAGREAEKAARYSQLIVEEREEVYSRILNKEFARLENKRMIEIGAGAGANIPFFIQAGFRPENISANELLADRISAFRKNYPKVNMLEGNALDIDEAESYDLVFQSTVFSSILDDSFRAELANKMLRLLAPGGIILSYDFIYNNPSNPDVKKFTISDIKRYFPGCVYEFHKVTLAPPVGRRVPSLYRLLNAFFPFLRSHLITVIRKK